MVQRFAYGAVLLAAALWLTACDSNNGGQPKTVSAFAAQDIDTATCSDSAPTEINDVDLLTDDTQTDVNALSPACL